MNTTKNKLIVRINKELQTQKREKIGSIFIPDQLMDFTNNLQFGEVIAVGSMAKKNIPDIEVGDIAIFDHAVEFKVVNKNTEKTKDQMEVDTHFLYAEDGTGDEIRHLHVCEDVLENQLFGIFKNNSFIPYKNYAFCYKEYKQTGFQMVNDVYINTEMDKKRIMNSLDLFTHEKSEYSKTLLAIPLNDSTYDWHESTKKVISEIDEHIEKLNLELNKPILAELTIAHLSSFQENNDVNKGDKVLINEKLMYPLDLMGARFILIKNFNWIYAIVSQDGQSIIPINNNVIIKEDTPIEYTNSGLIIPDSFKKSTYTGTIISKDKNIEAVKINDRVIFNKMAGIEIFIEKVKYLIMNQNTLLGIIN